MGGSDDNNVIRFPGSFVRGSDAAGISDEMPDSADNSNINHIELERLDRLIRRIFAENIGAVPKPVVYSGSDTEFTEMILPHIGLDDAVRTEGDKFTYVYSTQTRSESAFFNRLCNYCSAKDRIIMGPVAHNLAVKGMHGNAYDKMMFTERVLHALVLDYLLNLPDEEFFPDGLPNNEESFRNIMLPLAEYVAAMTTHFLVKEFALDITKYHITSAQTNQFYESGMVYSLTPEQFDRFNRAFLIEVPEGGFKLSHDELGVLFCANLSLAEEGGFLKISKGYNKYSEK